MKAQRMSILILTFITLLVYVKSECEPENCRPGTWTPWTECSVSCNKTMGMRQRERAIMVEESCGGTCDVDTSQTEYCKTDVCCPEDCELSPWSSWRYCVCTTNTTACKLNGQEVWVCTRSRSLIKKDSCGGYCDDSYKVPDIQCGNLCCRKNCILGLWNYWSPCYGQCEQEGIQFRSLRVVREPECGGTSCESMQRNETRSCQVGCCPVDCVLGEWGEWGSCDAVCGKGVRKRTRFVQLPECYGVECTENPDEHQYEDCTKYINVDCEVTPWSLWTSCVLDNGECGVGHKNRTRSVLVAAECVGKSCPNLTSTAVCYGECCRQDCLVSLWTEWGLCSSDCGEGISERKREIKTPASCGGTDCPKLLETKTCNIVNITDCVMSEWGEWTVCSNSCGTGESFRARKLLTKAYCGGQKCLDMALEDSKSCESYTANVDCVVNEWQAWGDCIKDCYKGVQHRNRTIKTNSICKGQSCPLLSMDEWQEWEDCKRDCHQGIQLRHRKIKVNKQCQGAKCPPNSGFRYCHEQCKQTCNPRTHECGCKVGFRLASNGFDCVEITCPLPMVQYCPPRRTSPQNCRSPLFRNCYVRNHTATCNATCLSSWNFRGPINYVTCQGDATWTQPEIYCTPNNTAPTDIVLLDPSKTKIAENTPAGYCVYFSTVDDYFDHMQHTYTIISDVSNRFHFKEHRLCLKVVANYEQPPHKWNITVRSTDLDGLYKEKTFEFEILNANDPPTAVILNPRTIPENSMIDTKVGCLTGKDDDPKQNLTFLLVNSNKGMFSTYTENGQICLKVAKQSDEKCPTEGGTYCLLNREKRKNRLITVMAADDGSPPEKAYFDIRIHLSDVNDKPTAVRLEPLDIPEEVAPGDNLVDMATEDEDVGQTYTYNLLSDPSGLFTITNGKLQASRKFDFETEKSTEFSMEVKSTDSGNPSLSVTSTITFMIRDMNEAPYDLKLTSENAPLSFENNKPKVWENAQDVTIGTVSVKDYDEGDKLTLTLLHNTDGRLSIKPPRCSSVADVNVYCSALLVANTSFNYETEPTLLFSLQVEDSQGLKSVVNLTLIVLDANDETWDILIGEKSVTDISVEENKLDTVIGQLSAIDEDLKDQHTFSLTDPTGLFVVDGNVLKTSATVTIDYEAKKNYTVTLTADDNGSPPMSHDKVIIINIIDVNEVPSDIQISNNEVPENSEPGVVVGELSTVDPDNVLQDRQSFTYELIDDKSDRFEIKGNKLQVKMSDKLCNNKKPCTLDYEEEQVVYVKVKVTDNGTPPLTFEKFIPITVTDINDPPTVYIAGNSIPENSPEDTEIGILTVSDEDSGQTVTVQLMDNTDVFYLKDGVKLMAKTTLDREQQPYYNVTIRATDNGSPSANSDTVLSIEVLNINEVPSFTGETTLSVFESSPVATVVGSIIAVDPDNIDSLTLTLAGVSEEFTLSTAHCEQKDMSGTKCSAELSTKMLLKYTAREVYTISIRAVDQQGSTIMQEYTINIKDKNDPPQDILFNGVAVTSLTIAENSADVDITELSALDPDEGQTHNFTLRDGSGLFELQGNIFRIKADAVIDYEKQNEYSLSVEVEDSGTPSLKSTKQLTIMVENVNERPSNLELDQNKVPENSDRDTVVGKLLVEDPDNVADDLQSFNFVMIDSAGGRFKVQDSKIKVAESNSDCLSMGGSWCKLNFEASKVFEIKVLVSDNGFPVQSQTFSLTIKVTDQNDPPRNLQLSDNKVEEHAASGTIIGNLTFIDEDQGQTHTFSLVSDSEGKFAIDLTGMVTKATNDALDTSKVYEIEVKVIDSGDPEQSIQRKFSIAVVGDTVITLTFTSVDGSTSFEDNEPSVEENSIMDTVVGTLQAESQDTSQNLMFSMKEANGLEIFKLSDVTCKTENEKRVCTTRVLVADKINYEAQSEYTIDTQVTTADSSKKTVEVFTVKILDVNEQPTAVRYSGGQPTVQENVRGVTIGVFTVDDSDIDDSHTFILTNDGAGKFQISQDGFLLVADDADIDYESQTSIDIEVKVTDKGGLTATQKFTVLIMDVNEKPSKVVLDNNQVDEMSSVGTVIGNLATEDPDNNQTFTYTLTDNAEGRFILDGNQVKVKSMGDYCETQGKDYCMLDFETETTHSIVVVVIDNGNPTMSSSFTLTVIVNDVNDPPKSLTMKSESLPEDLSVDSKVATLEVDDQDDTIFTYSITAGAEDTFTVTGNSIYLSKTLDYETKPSYTVTVEAVDNRGEPKTISQDFVLQVINVNEPPYSLTLEPVTGHTPTFPTNKPIIDENRPTETMIGQLVVLDHDASDVVTFTTTSTKVKLYNQNCILLTHGKRCTADVRSSAVFDFETESSVNLLFYATDSEGMKISKEISLTIQDANDPPTDVKVDGSLTIPENTVDVVMATLTAEDTDTIQTHSFTIHSNSKYFYIANNQLKVTSAAELDYEKQKSYKVTVRVTDNGTPALYYDKVLLVTLTDVNEAPSSIKLSANKIGEHSKSGEVVGSLITEDPDNQGTQRQTFTYTMTDTAGGRFKIDNTQVVVDTPDFDFEREKSYTISLSVQDNGTPPLTKEVKFDIDIIDSNDPPDQLDLSANSVAENSVLGAVVGTLSAVDKDDGQTLSYSMSRGDYFSVSGSSVVVSGSIDFETTPTITFEITVLDSGFPPLSTKRNFTVEITDENEGPADVEILDSDKVIKREIPESLLIDDVVGTIVAWDPDEADKLTFTLSGATVLKMSSVSPDCKKGNVEPYLTECRLNMLLKKIVNYEDPTQRIQKFTLTVTDHLGLQQQKEFIYNVINSNEPPYDIILGGEITSIPENTANYEIGQLESLDDDEDDQHIYQIIGYWELFTVKDGMLTAMKPLDYEQKQSYSVMIKSKDNGNPPQSFTKTFVFNVTNINEAPTGISVLPNEVSNAANIGDVVGIVTVTDPDNTGTSHDQTHTCTVGGDGVGVFTINSTTMQMKVSGTIPPDKNQTNIEITCTDSGQPPLSTTVEFVISIKETIEVPKILVLKDQKKVPENMNTFTVGRIEVVNQLSGETITGSLVYELSDPTMPYKIDGNRLQINGALDYEDKSEWFVTVTGSGTVNGKQVDLEETFKIEVSDVNEAPYKITVTGGGYIPENSDTGTVIGPLNTEDHELDQKYRYTLVAVARGLDIANANPVLEDIFTLDDQTLKIGTTTEYLNFEESRVYIILVNSVDSGNPPMAVNDTVNIVLQDVNDPPTDITFTQYTVAENSEIGTVIGNVIVTDEDQDQKHSCDLDNSRVLPFDITEELKLIVSKDEIDFEDTRTYVLEVSCEDEGQDGTQLSIKKAIIMNITNVNEAPYDIMLTNLEILESSQPGEIVGGAKGTDPDSAQVIFSVEGTSLFRIEGEDTLVTTGQLDYEDKSTHTITVKATDDGGLSSTKEFVLKVKDVNEAPTGIHLDTTEVEENLKKGGVVGTFSTTDPDREQSFTYTLVPGESDGYFAIADYNLVAGDMMLDYETNEEYKVHVKSTDNGNPPKSIQEEFTIKIKDVNEPPTSIKFESVAPLPENTPSKTVITTIQVDDEDNGQSHSCNLKNKSIPFAILTNEKGVVNLVLNHVIDYESAEKYDVVVQCSDGEFDIKSMIPVTVVDVNEPPTAIDLTGSKTVLANGQPGDFIGHLSATDPDLNQIHTFVLKGSNSDLFKIDRNELLLSSRIPSDVLSRDNPVIKITIQASDNGDPVKFIQQNFTLLITDIEIIAAELPSVAIDNMELAEDSEIGTIIGTLFSVNQTIGEDILFELEQNPDNLFSIENNKHLVLKTSLVDYSGTSLTIVIRVKNLESFEESSKSITILIKHVDRCLQNGKTCSDDARCVKLNQTYHACHCEFGFTGDGYTCTNIDDCIGDDACQNGATCVDSIGNFSCICPREFNGPRCEISLMPHNPCNKNPCKNDGVCISEDGKSYVCICRPGWTGAVCSDSFDDCKDSNCLAGGLCKDKHKTYICECPEGRHGTRCQYFTKACKADNCFNGTKDICVPLYDREERVCAKSVEDLVKLVVNNPLNGTLDELEYIARISDVILRLLGRTGVSTTENRRKRRSTDDLDIQVYIVNVTDNRDGTVSIDFIVLNTDAIAFTKEQVIEMLSTSCTDIEKEDMTETEVCPAIKNLTVKTTIPVEKDEGGSSGALIGGAAGGAVALIVIIIVIVVIVKKRNKDPGNGYKEMK